MTLNPDAERQIAEHMAGGGYASPAEVVTAALAALREKEEYERQLQALRHEIDLGLADLEAGRVRPLNRKTLQEIADRVYAEPDDGSADE
jgi:Arc/MetJ-type ribon-helix-helix transcriptional regulator